MNPAKHGLHFQVMQILAAVLLVGWTGARPLAIAEDAPKDGTNVATPEQKAEAVEKDVTQGALRIVKEDGAVVECPLKHTDVIVDISGFIARVKVVQTFHNPLDEKIEAVYVFPLPHEAAIDDMTMLVGERRIVGLIKRRAEARQIYEQALAAGQTTALLEQERPNIFTQSVGNIDPDQEVKIEISYVDVLRYDAGEYEFQFPMVVGPRYIPGSATSTPNPTPPELNGKVSPPVPDTTRVPDASRISPPVLKPDVRNGHDIALSLKLDAGVPVQNLSVANHKAAIERSGDNKASIILDPADSIPNKDFVLRYDVTGVKPAMAMLAHTGSYTDARRLGSGYFMLMIQPQEDERLVKSPPREIVFLVDVSGSMSGEPTAKVIDAMQSMLKMCRPQDSVQVVTFAGEAHKLFEKPVPVNEANINTALNFTSALQGSGGTEMLKGVQMAIDEPLDNERLRIVVMLTDGYIGNEAEIIEHVGKHCGDQIRFWCIGIGASPNMFLVDGVAKQGGGMGKQLGLQDDTTALTQEVITRIQRAQLAKIQMDWGGLQVAETYPARIPELWAGRPVILFGRYSGGGEATITVRGLVEGEAVSWPLSVALPNEQAEHDVLAKIWARRKIEDLMQQTFYQGSPAVEEEVTAIALDYKLMSQYTSFVAVDETDVASHEPTARPPRRMLVPVPLPQGTRWQGFFGPLGEEKALDKELKELRDGLSVFEARASVRRLKSSPLFTGASPASRAPGGDARFLMRSRAGGALGGQVAKREMSLARYYRSSSPSLGLPLNAPAPAGGGGAGYALFANNGPVSESLSEVTRLSVAFDEADADFTAAALAQNAQPLVTAAQELLATGKKALEKKDVEAARIAFEHAYFLDSAALASGATNGDTATQALQALTQIRDDQIQAWIKKTPALDKKLSLVLRDLSIDEGLQAIAKSAGVQVRLVPGSVDDGATIVGSDNVRIEYLDVRGATVAQALDWILMPASLTWHTANSEIVATSHRREAASAWVYDVSLIALPDAEAITQLNDYNQSLAAAQKSADELLSVIRNELRLKHELAATWFGPGQLLIVGDVATHEAAAKLFDQLANPKSKFKGATATLHQITSKRATDRKEKDEKRQGEIHRAFMASKHIEFGWQLMAEAAAGKLDTEALTQLQIAWKDPSIEDMLKGELAVVPLRSLWILHEVARVVPDDSELRELLATAKQKSQQAATDSLTALQENLDDGAAYGRVLYATLINRDNEDFVSKAAPLLTKERAADSPLARAVIIAQALLAKPQDVDSAALESLIVSGVGGDDLVLLSALACHRAGEQSRAMFHRESRDLLSKQPLSGEVVVLINRLSGSPLVHQGATEK